MARDSKEAPRGLSKSFDFTTPKAYLRAARNPAAFAILSGIEKRSERLQERAQELHRKFEDRWTAKEAIRLWARHHAQSGSHPVPEGTRRLTPEAFAKIASRNIQARTNARLNKIEDIRTRMSNAVVRTLEAASLKRSFDGAGGDGSPKKTLRRTQSP